FPNEDPIGKTLLVTSAGTPAEIVGIVGDVRSQRVAEPPGMEFYRPWAQESFPFALITVRSALEVSAITRLVQSAVATVDQGIGPVVIGLVIGVAGALALGRLIASQLYQTSAYNPFLLAATIVILGAAALIACVLPARRASMVNPVDALHAG